MMISFLHNNVCMLRPAIQAVNLFTFAPALEMWVFRSILPCCCHRPCGSSLLVGLRQPDLQADTKAHSLALASICVVESPTMQASVGEGQRYNPPPSLSLPALDFSALMVRSLSNNSKTIFHALFAQSHLSLISDAVTFLQQLQFFQVTAGVTAKVAELGRNFSDAPGQQKSPKVLKLEGFRILSDCREDLSGGRGWNRTTGTRILICQLGRRTTELLVVFTQSVATPCHYQH